MKRENFSRKRQAILEAIRSTNVHPTAEWVYQAVKPQYPDLSLGTVYRNIARFKEEGLILSIGVIEGQERFDGEVRPHNHFVCSECGAVLDLTERYLSEDVHQILSQKYGAQVVSHTLVFRGFCKECLEKSESAGQKGA